MDLVQKMPATPHEITYSITNMTGRVLQFKPLTCSKHNCSDFRELEILTQVEKNYAGKNGTWYYTEGLQASFPWNSEHRNTIKIKCKIIPYTRIKFSSCSDIYEETNWTCH